MIPLPPRPSVTGAEVTRVESGAGSRANAGGDSVTWSSLAGTDVSPGPRWVSFAVPVSTGAVLVPWCAGRTHVMLDEKDMQARPGPVVLDVPGDGREHRVSILLDVSGYEHRVACGSAPRVGGRASSREELVPFDFVSPHAAKGGGHAVLYVPPGHDVSRPAAVLVGLHPWNGSMWTYTAYEPLLVAARAADVVLLFPSGLGNSLYTADAEDEAMRALDALGEHVAVDPDRVTLWGASMGGAGATTIGFHHPDRFAAVVSLFGDSRYDLSTYVRGILHDAAGAHRVNALDIVDNARNLPVWLVHGEDDHVSPIAQSAVLDRAMRAMHFTVTFDRVPGAGHEGRVVSQFAKRIVDDAVAARRVSAPSRVSYWSVRPGDGGAYGIRLTRQHATGDAFFDLAREGETVHLVRAENVRELHLPRGAFGLAPTATPAVVRDDASSGGVDVTWDAAP